MKFPQFLLPFLPGGLFIVALLGVAITPRDEFGILLTWYVGAFLVYGVCLALKHHWRWWLGIGIVARIVLVFCFPGLSDDLYRFFWDGNLILSGINPFGTLPSDVIGSGRMLSPEMLSAYATMNSPEYHTVYPVTLQGLFAVASWISGAEIASFSVVLKIIFLSFECGTLWLLYHLLRDRGRTPDLTLYALNPLVIIELIGNLHGEAVMIFLMLFMYWFLLKQQIIASAGMLSLAIATKLIPLICLPFLLRRLPRKQFLLWTLITGFFTTLLFLPVLFTTDARGFLSSLGLYFRTFEFNASVYYLGRWIGYQIEGFNTIASTGPLMAMISICCMGLYWLRERKTSLENLPVAMLAALSIYYAFATTVHPWYLCPMIAFCTLTPFRFPIIWSALIFLSYSAYRSDPVEEVLWLIAIEYSVVIGWLVMEVIRVRKIRTAPVRPA